MKNVEWNFTEPMKIDDANGYASDVYEGKVSNLQNDICQVWGTSKEQINERLKVISKAPEMLEALRIIRDSFWIEPSESKKHIELQDIAKSLLKELES